MRGAANAIGEAHDTGGQRKLLGAARDVWGQHAMFGASRGAGEGGAAHDGGGSARCGGGARGRATYDYRGPTLTWQCGRNDAWGGGEGVGTNDSGRVGTYNAWVGGGERMECKTF